MIAAAEGCVGPLGFEEIHGLLGEPDGTSDAYLYDVDSIENVIAGLLAKRHFDP